jgi:hypothetical protein
MRCRFYIVEMHFLYPVFLVGKGQLAEHGLGIGYYGQDRFCGWTLEWLRAGPAAKPSLRMAVAEGFSGAGQGW